MRFKIDGRELSAEGMRVREVCAAEKALGMSMGDGTGAALAISIFVGMWRADPEKPHSLIAKDALDADVTSFDEDEDGEGGDAGPPEPAADEEAA